MTLLAKASTKSSKQSVLLEAQWPLPEIILNTRTEIEPLRAQVGLKIIDPFPTQQVQRRCGPWGQQTAYRHGQQPGYVVLTERKVPIPRPRLCPQAGGELPVDSYRLFQQNGRMHPAVACQLIRQGSTRDYAGALRRLPICDTAGCQPALLLRLARRASPTGFAAGSESQPYL